MTRPVPPPAAPARAGRGLVTARSLVAGLALGLAIDYAKAASLTATFATAVAVLFVLATADLLRRPPPGAPVVRLLSRACLLAAAAAALTAAAAPPHLTGWAVLVTTALALAGTLAPASSDEMVDTAMAAAGVGAGVAIIGLGVTAARGDQHHVGVAAIIAGMTVIGLAVAREQQLAAYPALCAEFRRLDAVYNGQLFAEHHSERLEVSDGLITYEFAPCGPALHLRTRLLAAR